MKRGAAAVGAALDAGRKQIRLDSWSNVFSKMGVAGRDKRTAATVNSAPVFTVRADMDALYHGNDLARKIIDLPAQEMVRSWIRLRSASLSTEESTKLSRDVLDGMETRKVSKTVEDALAWANLYGGCCVFMGVDDGLNVRSPLDLKKARSLKFLNILDRHELQVKTRYGNPVEAKYGEPETYEISTVMSSGDVRGFADKAAVSGQIIHETRLLRFGGPRTGRWRSREVNNGWADSVFVSVISTLRGHDSVWMSSEALMQDFAQAVIKIQGLADMMSEHGEDEVMTRMELMDVSRSVLRALILDADNEDFERKPTPMTGLPEVLQAWMHRLSAATGIPVTLLFGRSPAGQNATGDSDFRIFYDKISAAQERDLRPQLERLIEVLLNVDDGPTGGIEPESWQFDFLPLWRLNALEESERRKNIAETDEIYINSGVLGPEEVTRSRFAGEDYSAETVVGEEALDALAKASEERLQLELNPPQLELPVDGRPPAPNPPAGA